MIQREPFQHKGDAVDDRADLHVVRQGFFKGNYLVGKCMEQLAVFGAPFTKGTIRISIKHKIHLLSDAIIARRGKRRTRKEDAYVQGDTAVAAGRRTS